MRVCKIPASSTASVVVSVTPLLAQLSGRQKRRVPETLLTLVFMSHRANEKTPKKRSRNVTVTLASRRDEASRASFRARVLSRVRLTRFRVRRSYARAHTHAARRRALCFAHTHSRGFDDYTIFLQD